MGTRLRTVGAAALVIVGAILLFPTLSVYSRTSRSSAEPETVSLATAIARGPSGNANLIVTDFAICQAFVGATRGTVMAVDQGGWYALAPTTPGMVGPPDCATAPVRAMVKTTRGADVARALLRPPLAVQLGGARLSEEVIAQLRTIYPQTHDWSSVLVLQDGALPGRGRVIGLLVASVACLLGGAALGWLAFKRWREG